MRFFTHILCHYYFSVLLQFNPGLGRITVQVSISHASSRAPLYEFVAQAATYTTRLTQETDIHVLGGILTCNPSIQAATDPHLRPYAVIRDCERNTSKGELSAQLCSENLGKEHFDDTRL